jgi:hypothetical protein
VRCAYLISEFGSRSRRFTNWVNENRIWLLTVGKWIVIEKIVAGIFVYCVLGELVSRNGQVYGSFLYWIIVSVLSIIFLCWYDYNNKDLFCIDTIKAKFHSRYKWSVNGPLWKRIPFLFVSFVLALWQLAPPLIVLCFRKENAKPNPVFEYPLIVVYAFGSLLVWIPINYFILEPIKRCIFE